MTLIVGATAVDKVFFNDVELEKVYMNGVLVFGSEVNTLTVGSQGGRYGFSDPSNEYGFGSLSQTTFTGYGGSIDSLFWFTDPGDALAILRLTEGPYPSKVQVTVGSTVLVFQNGHLDGAYSLPISQTIYNALPKSGTVNVKFEVMA